MASLPMSVLRTRDKAWAPLLVAAGVPLLLASLVADPTAGAPSDPLEPVAELPPGPSSSVTNVSVG